MRTRRLGKLGHESTVIIYGAAMLSDVTQEVADRSIAEALDAGINHFDAARSYGEAEVRLGPNIPAIRDRIFLATKTGERKAEDAWRQINESLERLQTDHVDLLQLHAVVDLGELDKATGTGGALEAAIRARDEGLTRAIGITGHGHAAPSTHLEALRRFDFDSVLTPLNYTLGQKEDYYRDWLELAEETRRRDVALMIIKTGAKRNWVSEEHTHSTWYEPLTEQERITAALAWVLSHEQVTGIASPGDVGLLSSYIQAERDGASMTQADAADVLSGVSDYSSPFENQPI